MTSSKTIRGFNGFNGGDLRGYLSEIAAVDGALLELKSAYMNQCKKPKGKIREIMLAAKEAGMNMKALRELIADDRAKRARKRRVDALEPDDADDYQAMVDALGAFGDTPLGTAALERAKARGDETLAGLS